MIPGPACSTRARLAGDCRKTKPTDTMKTIASQKYEWTTLFLKRAKSGEYFTCVRNGGSRGTHQPADQARGDWGFWRVPLHAITDDEAEALADEMGVEIE